MLPAKESDLRLWRWQLRQLRERQADINLAIAALERIIARETAGIQTKRLRANASSRELKLVVPPRY
jgi:hypothetical protein